MEKQNNIPKLRFPEFSDGWEVKKFDEIFLFSTGKNIKQNEASPEFETPCVRYGELYHMYNEVINEVINKTNLDKSELLFSEGDEILLPSAGEDPMDIGSASALTIRDVAIGRTINILKPLKANFYSQIYAAYYINYKLKKDISKLAKGVSISNVYNSDLKTLKITLPTLAEQQKIATFLSTVDEKLQALKKKKSLLETYKKGVMQKLFSQQIRFKDDNGNDFENWEMKTLGEVCDFTNGKAHENEIDENGKFIVVNSKFVSTNGRVKKCSNRNILPLYKNDIVLVMSDVPNGKTLGKCFLIDKDNKYTLNQRICALRSDTNYTPFLISLISRNEYYLSFDSGVGQTNLKKEDVLNCPLFIPTSNEEQTKIANFLTAIDEKINKVDAQVNQTELWKKGLLQGMFV